MKLYCTEIELPSVDKSGPIWKVGHMTLTFMITDIHDEMELEQFKERIGNEFCQMNPIEDYKISLR